MIEISGLAKYFGTHLVLRDINLKIKDKTILGLIGINGAGKSTLLRCISGIYSPDSGLVMVDGKNAYDKASFANAGSSGMACKSAPTTLN